MAEKAATKKRPARQQMLEALAETEKTVAERQEAASRPEARAEAKAVAGAIGVADDLSTRGAGSHWRAQIHDLADPRRHRRSAGGAGPAIRAAPAGHHRQGSGA